MYMDALFGERTIMKEQITFKIDRHRIYTARVNKIPLRNIDDKRLQTYDKVTTYPYGTSTFIVCKQEMLIKTGKNPIPVYIK